MRCGEPIISAVPLVLGPLVLQQPTAGTAARAPLRSRGPARAYVVGPARVEWPAAASTRSGPRAVVSGSIGRMKRGWAKSKQLVRSPPPRGNVRLLDTRPELEKA